MPFSEATCGRPLRSRQIEPYRRGLGARKPPGWLRFPPYGEPSGLSWVELCDVVSCVVWDVLWCVVCGVYGGVPTPPPTTHHSTTPSPHHHHAITTPSSLSSRHHCTITMPSHIKGNQSFDLQMRALFTCWPSSLPSPHPHPLHLHHHRWG